MAKNFISVPYDQFHKLLAFRIRADIEAEFNEKIKAVERELELEQSSSQYWDKRWEETNVELQDAQKQIEALRDLANIKKEEAA